MFHISRRDLGARVTLEPRVPVNATKHECRSTPRVCFAPTIEQCLIGLVGFGGTVSLTIVGAFAELANSEWSPTVYKTDAALVRPDRVSDFAVTDEHWALTPIEVERIGYIDCLEMMRRREVVLSDLPRTVSFEEYQDAFDLSDSEIETLDRLLA